jgi:hypothetical protein
MADRRWDDDERGEGVADAIRASMFRLLGSIAEPSSCIRQRRTGSGDEMLTFDVVTGIVDEMPFEPHRHTLRLSVTTTT